MALKDVDFGSLKVDIQVGKNGISTDLIDHIDKMFESKEVIKIKFLQNFLVEKDLVGSKTKKKELIDDLANKTGSKRVFFVGNTFCIYKKMDPAKKREKMRKNTK